MLSLSLSSLTIPPPSLSLFSLVSLASLEEDRLEVLDAIAIAFANQNYCCGWSGLFVCRQERKAEGKDSLNEEER